MRASFAVLRLLVVALLGVLGALGASSAMAQGYPTAPSPFTSYVQYDSLGRVVGKIAQAASGTTGPFLAVRTTYDSAGRPVLVEEGSLAVWQGSVAPASWTGFSVGRKTVTTYDQFDRKLTEKLVGSDGVATNLTQYSYDDAGRLECTAVRMNAAAFVALPADACTPGTPGTQGPDRITRNVYDAADQVVQVRKAAGTNIEQAYVTTSYTANGKPDYIIDANGNRAQMTYDEFDRELRWSFPSSTTPASFNPATLATALSSAGAVNQADYEQYGYDANGNRTSLRKRDGSTLTYTYDALNRVVLKTVPERAGLGTTHTRDVYYKYDLRGLQLYARFDSATGEGVQTTSDELGRVGASTSLMSGYSRKISYLYDANGNRKQLKFPDANTVTYNYDALDRPVSILRSGTATIASYSYDSQGRRISFNGGFSTSYGYDPAGRLNDLTNNLAAPGANNQWTFAYNPANQIAQTTRSNDAFAFTARYDVNRAYTANGLNQYNSAGPAVFCYDANGNLTADGASVYLYDVENRLVEKRAQGTGNTNCNSLSYAGTLQAGLRYDPLGRLYEVTGPSGTTRMLYDGDALAAEYNGTTTLLRRYVHGADLKADDPIAWYEGSAYTGTNERFMRTDWQGSIVAVSDSSGSTMLSINAYDEYGIPKSSNAGRFQYTGQAWISELGMYYYKARIYSPTLGRFLQTDPIGYEDQMNLYAYVGNDPVNKVDPSGRNLVICVATGPAAPACAGLGALAMATGALAVICAADAECRRQAQSMAIKQCASSFVCMTVAVIGLGTYQMVNGRGNSNSSSKEKVHGNDLSSKRVTYVYRLVDRRNGTILKFGITSNPAAEGRYAESTYGIGQLRMDVLSTHDTRAAARADELSRCQSYVVANGKLPPLSKVC